MTELSCRGCRGIHEEKGMRIYMEGNIEQKTTTNQQTRKIEKKKKRDGGNGNNY